MEYCTYWMRAQQSDYGTVPSENMQNTIENTNKKHKYKHKNESTLNQHKNINIK